MFCNTSRLIDPLMSIECQPMIAPVGSFWYQVVEMYGLAQLGHLIHPKSLSLMICEVPL